MRKGSKTKMWWRHEHKGFHCGLMMILFSVQKLKYWSRRYHLDAVLLHCARAIRWRHIWLRSLSNNLAGNTSFGYSGKQLNVHLQIYLFSFLRPFLQYTHPQNKRITACNIARSKGGWKCLWEIDRYAASDVIRLYEHFILCRLKNEIQILFGENNRLTPVVGLVSLDLNASFAANKYLNRSKNYCFRSTGPGYPKRDWHWLLRY